MHVDDVVVATARALYYVLCVHTKRFLWRSEKACGRPFKMRSVGLVETETFFDVA